MDRKLILDVSANQAFGFARRNRLRRYPSPEQGGERLYPLAWPVARPSFQILPTDTVFTIGSCFARNVEAALIENGMTVLSRDFDLGEVGESVGEASNFFNKYSIHSIYNELKWALERDSFPGEAILYSGNTDQPIFDPQLGQARIDFPMEKVLAFRHRYLDAMAQVKDADVIIITLGYVETWYDRELDIYLNVIPPVEILRKYPDRFQFRVLGYAEILEMLHALHALLLKHREKPLKMLITVSPVPLLATFRDMDVLMANAYSKSVQRAVLDQFVTEVEQVDYFPSYEFVTLSNPTIAWSRNDYRHVNPDLVARIMSSVIATYFPADAQPKPQAAASGTKAEAVASAPAGAAPAAEGLTPAAIMSTAKLMLKLEEWDKLAALFVDNAAVVDGHPDLLLQKAAMHRQKRQTAEEYAVLEQVHQLAPDRPWPLERMIRLCRPLRRQDHIGDLLARHVERFPARSEFRDQLA
ncbi:GSCFA domain-containing protein [Paracoccus sp. M683]|uniref:GSCFA domain-containing protein n=1 Tax=Paracoccus sp. M683 TaxID=2594268 RepID=UPI00117FD9DF|nr:GSCFA domain-containing protein [Paracoccus sp. M683]TRW96269.1 GSCFA domain-containing protein [Paracoccus sp. M683]